MNGDTVLEPAFQEDQARSLQKFITAREQARQSPPFDIFDVLDAAFLVLPVIALVLAAIFVIIQRGRVRRDHARAASAGLPPPLPKNFSGTAGVLLIIWFVTLCIPQHPVSIAPPIFYFLFGIPAAAAVIAYSINLRWIMHALETCARNSTASVTSVIAGAFYPAAAFAFSLALVIICSPNTLHWPLTDNFVRPRIVLEAQKFFRSSFLTRHHPILILAILLPACWAALSLLMLYRRLWWWGLCAGLPMAITGYIAHAMVFYSQQPASFVGITVPIVATPIWMFVVASLATMLACVILPIGHSLRNVLHVSNSHQSTIRDL